METIFRVGDEVYTAAWGWGKVKYINHQDKYSVIVVFDDNTYSFNHKGEYSDVDYFPDKHLSFTEYTVEVNGLSIDRPIDIAMGTPIFVNDSGEWKVMVFSHSFRGKVYCFNESKVDGPTSPWDKWSLESPMEYGFKNP